MLLTRDQIGALIPHAGTMRLLDGVLSWDDASIRCVSSRHRAPDNPLREKGRLGALCAIEFAAQAMAAHGRLSAPAGERSPAGYIASLRDVVCRCDRLDDIAGDLLIDAKLVMGDDAQAVYAFSVSGGTELVSGRATVLMRPRKSS